VSTWLEDLISGQEFGHFVDLTEKYCSTCERIDSLPLVTFLLEIDRLLPQVYGAASVLPAYPWDDDEDGLDEHPSTCSQLDLERGMYDRMRKKLGCFERYDLVFDPYDSEGKEVIDGTLADDLASIYADLKSPLDLFRDGSEPAIKQALWDWGFGRKIHWGRHAVHAMAAVYSLVHSHYDDDDGFDIAPEQGP
jgi:hypothetical protein